MPFAKAGDLSLFYQESGSGSPVLMLPGLGADHMAWGYQALKLQAHFRCIRIDNRDVGRSDRATAPYTIRDMAQDTVELLDALEINSAHVVGWSMGSAIAQELVLHHPERVRSLSLVATYHEGDPRADDRFHAMAEVRKAMGMQMFMRLSYPGSFTYRAYERPGFIEGMMQRALDNQYGQEQEAYERQVQATLTHNTAGRLSNIACPTLVLVGDEDILTPLERFARPIAGEIPNAVLRVIPEVGHALVWEQPDAVSEALLEFLMSVALETDGAQTG